MIHTYNTLAWQPIKEQNDWQAKALKDALQYLQQYSPFYQRIFKEQCVDISKISSLDNLQYLPATSKSDMQEHNMDFLCVPKNEVKEYMATSGTMGAPVTIVLTKNDLERLAYNEHQSFLCADGQSEDIYQLMLTLDRQFMAGIAYYTGIKELGASVIRTGPGLPAMQWDTILNLKTTSVVAVPSFLLKMIAHAKEAGIGLKNAPVTKAICIGENLRNEDFTFNALGQKINNEWPIKLYSTYASTEMQTAFTECTAGRGGHHQPDLVIVEVVDEELRPLKAGEYGEVLITTLGVEGMPLLRYRTGDICAYYDEPCSCGRMSRRLSAVLGRKQQMIKYKGTTLYPQAIFNVLNHVTYIAEYVVEVFTNELGTDELILHINTPLSADDCEQRLRSLLQSKIRVAPIFHYHGAAALQQMQFPANSRKQIRFIDNRKNILNK